MGSKPTTRPPRLAPGSRIALVAPSGPLLERDELTRAAELCRELGHDPLLGPHSARRHGYLGGTDVERLADLNAALRDASVDAVWCLRGGYGLTRILDRIDYAALEQRPKAIIGFSDVTALLLAALRAAGVVSFHGPTARQPMTAFTRRNFTRVLWCAEPAGALEQLAAPADVLVPRAPRLVPITSGTAEGPLIGGNLSLIQCLIGTPWLPELDGALVFLEDVGEDLYRVDRALSHLRLAGVLNRIAGLMIGQFTEMRKGTGDGALGFDEVLEHYIVPLGIPAAYGFPIGHVDEQWTIPVGARARLDVNAGELNILEPAVA
jgi:muramoyltetrapeptide carboxypeptidase